MSKQNILDEPKMKTEMTLLDSNSPLGYSMSGFYIISTQCECTLDELLSTIENENKATRNIRRKWGSQGTMAQDLVSIVKVVDIEEQSVFKKSVKLLTFLTEPIEFLMTSQDTPDSTKYKEKVVDINKLLIQAKDACDNVEFLKKLKLKITVLLEKSVGTFLSDNDCETINDCLLLLRNILQNSVDKPSQTSTLLRHVFESKLEKILFALGTHEQQDNWSAMIVQLLWFFLRNHVDVLLNKSARSYQLVGNFDTDTAMERLERDILRTLGLTDSAYCSADDVVEAVDRHRESDVGSKPTRIVRFTTVTQIGSSNDSDYFADQKSKSNNSGSNSIDEAEIIERCLMQFVMGFLRSAFSDLVASLIRAQVSSSPKITDFYYLGWMMTFFLKVAKKSAIVPVNIERFMNTDVIAFLVNDAKQHSIHLTELKREMAFCSFTHRRLDLTVRSLYQVFDLFVILKDDDLNSSYLDGVSRTLAQTNGLRHLFLLLLRNYDSQMQHVFYLHQIIETNHILMLLLEDWYSKGYTTKFDMFSQVKLFGTYDIMLKYGSALETFESNTQTLNNSVLTMMYHVAGDCDKSHVLQQLPILTTFTAMWESHMPLTDVYNDFMEYVMGQFMTRAAENPLLCAQMLVETEATTERGLKSMELETVEEHHSPLTDKSKKLRKVKTAELKDQDTIIDDLMEHFEEIGLDKHFHLQLHTEDIKSLD